MNSQADNTSKDQPVDELDEIFNEFETDTITDRNANIAHLKVEVRNLIQAECNRARLAEARYVENYFDGEAFYPDEWQRRIAELQQIMKGRE